VITSATLAATSSLTAIRAASTILTELSGLTSTTRTAVCSGTISGLCLL
jgi:hypothetical protein